jgi:hypothetical protein
MILKLLKGNVKYKTISGVAEINSRGKNNRYGHRWKFSTVVPENQT